MINEFAQIQCTFCTIVMLELTSISFQEIKKKKHSTYEIIINNEGSGSRVNQAEKFKANQQRNSEQSAQTFKVSWQKKNPISTKEFKQYQASIAESQSKVTTLERS